MHEIKKSKKNACQAVPFSSSPHPPAKYNSSNIVKFTIYNGAQCTRCTYIPGTMLNSGTSSISIFE